MKFYLICALILSIAFFVATAHPQSEDHVPKQDNNHDHHHVLRSLGSDIATDTKPNKDGEAGCCG